MTTLRNLGLIGLACAMAACGGRAKDRSDAGSQGTYDPDAGCYVVDAGPVDPVLAQEGLAIIEQNKCQQCHGEDLAGNNDGVQFMGHGQVYPPNLTSDPATGLGCWTNDQIVNAIMNGVDNENQPVCPPMPHFSAFVNDGGFDMSGAVSIVQFLRSLPSVRNEVPSTPTCSAWGMDDGGCNVDEDCQAGDVCVYQFCGAAPADGGMADGGQDGGQSDGGMVDSGSDGGPTDAGADGGDADGGLDAGISDAGPSDSGTSDAGADGGVVDAGSTDAGSDAGISDAGPSDSGTSDAGADAGNTDAGVTDAGTGTGM